MISDKLKTFIKSRAKDFEEASDKIWELAELRYNEFESAKFQEAFLQKEGFKITSNLGGLETAFVAESGSGKPVLAFFGEFDALPNLSQKANENTKSPIIEGAPGHGCGHNLLGTAAMEAAIALKEENLPGTVRYYACPAEESGAGKAFMLRAGSFSDVDVAISWHPFTANCLLNNSLANVRVIYEFSGLSSHASSSPHLGRSALDAAELMNIGANFLREHIITEARLHYAFLDSGGEAPNIVQPFAKLVYAIRAPKISQVNEIMERVNDVARGAALMTGTSVKISIVSAYANLIPNDTLDELMLDNAKALFPLVYSDDEIAFASKFANDKNEPLETTLITSKNLPPTLSTDFGDVSWVVPATAMAINCFAKGSVLHSWPIVAQGKSNIAYKGMHIAATIMASCGLDILRNPSLAQKAKEDLIKTLSGAKYKSLIPLDVLPFAF